MKINKSVFLSVLAKYLIKVLGIPENLFDPSKSVQAVSSVFNIYAPQLREEKIITDDNRIDVTILEEKVTQLFSMIPILRIPSKQFNITITEEIAKEFLADIKKLCDVETEEVICLPCQK